MYEGSVLWLYAPWEDVPGLPRIDDMFDNRERLQHMFADPTIGGMSLNLEIGHVLSPASGRNELPSDVRILSNPKFDGGKLLNHDLEHFKQGDIEDYAVVLDHWVQQFRYKVEKPDGIVYEEARGLGLPKERLINYMTVQERGNNKALAESEILQPCNASVDTCVVSEFGAHEEEWREKWGNEAVIFKPRSGSMGRGVKKFESVDEFKAAIASGSGEVALNGVVQPFLDLKRPIPGLKALSSRFDEQLREVNGTADRVREVRKHLCVSTENGVLEVVVNPMLKTSEKGSDIMKNWTYTPLDPEAFEDIYPEIVSMAEDVGRQTAKVANVPHFYGVADVCIGMHRRLQSPLTFVGDLNLRGPRLPDFGPSTITPAQRAFIKMHKTMYKQNMQHVA